MKKKILIVIFTLNLFSFLSCLSCDEYRFYDYTGIEVVVSNPIINLEDESLLIKVHFKGGHFLAQTNKMNNFGNSLYAYSLYAYDCDKGFDGDKYPLTRISITSDSDFNDEYLADNELNDIVYVRGTNANGEYDILDKVSNFHPSQINIGYLYIYLKPELDKTHKITIEIEKSNGEILSATSEEIIWE